MLTKQPKSYNIFVFLLLFPIHFYQLFVNTPFDRKDDDSSDEENEEDEKNEEEQKKDKEEENKDKDEDEKDYPYSMLYDYQQFERDIINNSKQQSIVQYVENVLNILGVKYSCGHVEVMYLPKEEKVCLIELNGRMHGGLPRATKLVGYDQMSLLALMHCDPARFLTDIPKYYNCSNPAKGLLVPDNNMEKYINNDNDDDNKTIDESITVRAIFLRSKVDGRIDMKKLIGLQDLKTFKTFARSLYDGVNYWKEYTEHIENCRKKLQEIEIKQKEKELKKEKGGGMQDFSSWEKDDTEEKKQEYLKTLEKSLQIIDRIEECEKTIDLITCPGTVVLEGKVDDVVEDYKTIRALEDDVENGLFIAK